MPKTEESADGFPVDASIVDIIDRLRRHGYETTASCSGLRRDHPEYAPENGGVPDECRSGFVMFVLGKGEYDGNQNGYPISEIKERDSLDPISEEYRGALQQYQSAAAEASGDWEVELARREGEERIVLRVWSISKSDEERMEYWESLREELESRQIQS